MNSSNPINPNSGIPTSEEHKNEDRPVEGNALIQSIWGKWSPISGTYLTDEPRKGYYAEYLKLLKSSKSPVTAPAQRRNVKSPVSTTAQSRNVYDNPESRKSYCQAYLNLCNSSSASVTLPPRSLSEEASALEKQKVDEGSSPGGDLPAELVASTQNVQTPTLNSSEETVDRVYHSAATPANPQQDIVTPSVEADLPVELDEEVWKEWTSIFGLEDLSEKPMISEVPDNDGSYNYGITSAQSLAPTRTNQDIEREGNLRTLADLRKKIRNVQRLKRYYTHKDEERKRMSEYSKNNREPLNIRRQKRRKEQREQRVLSPDIFERTFKTSSDDLS
jgi:hypothetical protein